ncbi:tRNA preQ1(34) S-adenosylmethionine ribosyltransferase-isomerase QueA [Candidatus Ichthyocystis sparus]|uniref:tRNA preQ1(34) S-adenosylmethionine ribosyltransferase-isomerase QueA n=1 Tax=Candidatus Ichthyocystis sparus TaxID=1561004 RepID=UPI000A47486A|nr:tRNA preQ1(34) S-adenosylmethionine ribosyltransferase-isomerase QueA [Candidatus Ichthyocystis sparus]
MKLSDFDFNFDHDQIAQHPAQGRESARLMNASTNQDIKHQFIYQLPEILTEEHIIVINNTKVIRARLIGRKETGGSVEIFLERLISSDLAMVQIKTHKKPQLPFSVIIDNRALIVIKERVDGTFFLGESQNIMSIFNEYGEIPIPPYLNRKAFDSDAYNYQTVFANVPGSVAAPTAGLHFTESLIDKLKKIGIEFCDITLHVGAGTFQKIHTEDLSNHKMHREYYRVPNKTRKILSRAIKNGKKIIAVGTTVVRALESYAQHQNESDEWQSTTLFIKPGFKFRITDLLITNFHQPKSSLIVLVSSFAGHNIIKRCYDEGLKNNYRLFSYGDAMLLKRER